MKNNLELYIYVESLVNAIESNDKKIDKLNKKVSTLKKITILSVILCLISICVAIGTLIYMFI